jgi:hypothetical protein
MKSVPNLISYLHEFSWNFSQLLAICFELFSFGTIFNSKNHCCGVPLVSLSLSLCVGPACQHAVSARLLRAHAHAMKAPADSAAV